MPSKLDIWKRTAELLHKLVLLQADELRAPLLNTLDDFYSQAKEELEDECK